MSSLMGLTRLARGLGFPGTATLATSQPLIYGRYRWKHRGRWVFFNSGFLPKVVIISAAGDFSSIFVLGTDTIMLTCNYWNLIIRWTHARILLLQKKIIVRDLRVMCLTRLSVTLPPHCFRYDSGFWTFGFSGLATFGRNELLLNCFNVTFLWNLFQFFEKVPWKV